MVQAVGYAVGHIEGVDKVTGRARYTADVDLPGMLWGRCLRSPYPHARLLAIDTSRASALPGVHAVITGADLPDIRIGRRILDMPVLARERVRFAGEKVAAVAAETREIAEEALLLIEVEYEELPAVFEPEAAMRSDAPLLHDEPAAYQGAYLPIPDVPNVLSQVTYGRGDIDAGFAAADRIFEHSFTVPRVHQGYIEPHACVLSAGPDGDVDAWLTNKGPFGARGQIAAAIGVEEQRVRVHQVPIGGDFGGKGDLMDAVVAYHLSARSRRPVKMVMSYTEELLAGNPRHAAEITIRTGVTSDGRMTARRARVVFNSGAYGAFKPTPTVNLGGASNTAGPYRLPALAIESLMVYTNTVPAGHMRAPGAPQAVFSLESHVDMIAAELGMDPLEFRLRNVLQEGDAPPLGGPLHNVRGAETLRTAAEAAGWGAPRKPDTGLGLALYERRPGGGRSNATLSIDAGARFTLLTAVPDTGTGSHTILQQLIAEELQVPLDWVSVVAGDTNIAEFDGGAGGSRVTHAAGGATVAAAVLMREALVDRAARLLDRDASRLSLRNGAVVADDGIEAELQAVMAFRDYLDEPGTIVRVGSYEPEGPPDVTSFAAQIAEVAVDRETGAVSLQRLVTVHDVGTVINPLTHQGQIEGGVVQGIGQALIEQLTVEDGAVTSLYLGEYKLPTMADVPALETVLIADGGGPVPHAGKSIGETPNVPVAAAIANAVYAACGVRIRELPITAERVYAALHGGVEVG